VWVIDSADQRRMYETGLELAALLKDDRIRKIPLLIFANKNDLSLALSSADVPPFSDPQITIELELDLIRDRSWQIQSCSATRKTGVNEGLKWMVSQLCISPKK
jgi:ADP-ribosylation factor-like protein 3